MRGLTGLCRREVRYPRDATAYVAVAYHRWTPHRAKPPSLRRGDRSRRHLPWRPRGGGRVRHVLECYRYGSLESEGVGYAVAPKSSMGRKLPRSLADAAATSRSVAQPCASGRQAKSPSGRGRVLQAILSEEVLVAEHYHTPRHRDGSAGYRRQAWRLPDGIWKTTFRRRPTPAPTLCM